MTSLENAITGNVIVYQAENESVSTNVLFKDETFWMTQKDMAKLFDVNVPAISKHLKNIFESGELVISAVISKMETTAEDGKIYQTNFYNLDAIIAVGYRVNSKKATQFRIWATGVLREYIIKGFALDDVMLKTNTLCQNALSPCFSGSVSGFAGAGCSSGLVKAQSNSSAASRKIFWEFEPRMTSPYVWPSCWAKVTKHRPAWVVKPVFMPWA